MTDNEKRAHDLAIASVQIVAMAEINRAASLKVNIDLDFYKMYTDRYSAYLEKLDHDSNDR